MSNPRSAWISLNSGDLTAEIDPLGAQLSILKDRTGRDLLWNGNASIWTGRAPLLFPIVGALVEGTYRLGSELHHLSRHGFARGSPFQLIDLGRASAAFRLNSDDGLFERYPFHFELDVHYRLEGSTLSTTALIRNLGAEDMPASFGFHPGFNWPLPFGHARSSHFIEFEVDEPSPVRRLDHDGLLMPERHATPIIQRRLALDDSLFQKDVLIFDAVRSRSVSYGATSGPRIRLSFPDAPYLGVWTKPQAGFVCIEPWHGVADPQGFSGDFREKPGIFQVAPGAARAITMAITLLDGIT